MKVYYAGEGVMPSTTTLPIGCNTIAGWNDNFYAAAVDPGRPGRYGGPPDAWEPPEEPNINELYIWNVEQQDWVKVPDTEEIPFQLEEALFQVLERDNPFGE
jgi:hypothetical protein